MLDEKFKKYLLADLGGKKFPKGKCPSLKEFFKSVLHDVKLWPMQKLILKVICNTYGLFPTLELTDWEKNTLDRLRRNAHFETDESKYAQCIIRRDRTARSPLVILLVCGRGSGKTFMAGLLVAYFIRFLLSLGDPHRFFKLAKVKPIAIQCLAGKETQAVSLFRVVKNNVRNCQELDGTYESLRESVLFGNTLEARAYTSSANTTRGEDTFCYYHEETAYCAEDTPDSEKSFTQCYKAIQPAVKNRFAEWGIMLFVTSAGLKRGKTWELYRQIKSGVIKNCIMFQLATWEINPKYSKADFQQEYDEDFVTADAEHGSQFVDAKSTFLTPAEVYSCIRQERTNMDKGNAHTQYWIRLDPSRVHDRYALALGHKERTEDGKIIAVVDHVKWWQAYWTDAEGNIQRPRRAADRARMKFHGVNTQEILAYLHMLVENFNVIGVSSDQFESQYIVEEMNECYGTDEYPFGFIKPITQMSNWLAYRNLKKLIYQGCFEIYEEQAFIEEALVAMRFNKNKPLDIEEKEDDDDDETVLRTNLIYTVEAPRSGSVTTDDVLDSVTFLAFDMMSNMDLAPANAGESKAYGVDTKKKEREMPLPSLADEIPENW